MEKGTVLLDRKNLRYRFEGLGYYKKTDEVFLIVTFIDSTADYSDFKHLYDEETFKEEFTVASDVGTLCWHPYKLPFKHCKNCKYGVEGDCYEDASCVKWGLKEGRNFSFREKCSWFTEKK